MTGVVPTLDRVARSGLAAGVALMLQPWWADGFRWGFFITALCTAGHIATSHAVAAGAREEEEAGAG